MKRNRKEIIKMAAITVGMAFLQATCSGLSRTENDAGTDDTDTETSEDTETETDTGETCYEGDYQIETVDDLTFFQQYDCITGSLIISVSDYEEINLPKLNWIGGSLTITSCNSIVNLNGISNLTYVGEILGIIYNDELEKIDGLNHLLEVKELTIIGNNILGNVDGLEALKEITDRIIVRDNYSLTDLDGLEDVKKIVCDGIWGPCVQIFNNTSLPQCEACAFLLQLEDFSGNFSFTNNMADSCSDTCN
jgi:hypothetical protein